jgi:CRISPR-associated endonuclease Csn1
MAILESTSNSFVLGIDLGTSSVGWAIVLWKDGGPAGILRAGSRVFDAGMDVDSKSGKESSRNLARRAARLIRRQHWRRRRRLRKVFRLLKLCGLLPAARVETVEARQNFLNELDRAIIGSPWFAAKCATGTISDPQHVMPYLLRSAALDEPLEPFFLGRALYHLAQRRGYLSNRKEAATKSKNEDEKGKVETGITELQKSMEASGARTLGEYFCRVNIEKERIRQRWTSRQMYEREFDRIWDSQSRFHPDLLTPQQKKELRSAIFFQRPLKPQKYLIGKCEFEPEESRAPMYFLLSQRIRLLQKVNDLWILPAVASKRRLSPEERAKLLAALELDGDQTFPDIRALLGLPKITHFNLQEGGETKILGNRTGSQLYSVFGERWLAMPGEERAQVVEYVNGFQRGDKIAAAAQKKWDLSSEAAEKFAAVRLEADYSSLSRRAMEKLLPSLEEGSSLEDARFNAYGKKKDQSEIVDLLPPVDRWREIRNPGVTRTLTELRKVINAIIRQYGKPAEIRIELARDLRQTKAQREKTWKKNRENQRSREKAAKKILDEIGLAQPSNDDIRKVLLAEECNFSCPYTSRTISMSALIGRESQYDIEHIIPFSRSLDNSFPNLTLCYHEENRNVKRNQTPSEAYASQPELFQDILGRVDRFRSDFKKEKLRRFKMTTAEVDEAMKDFTARQLNDTRYATKLAGDYLAMLYGGRVDASGTQRIRATAGQVTAFLRSEWKLNAILQDGPTANGGAAPKSREDHRHHAVDAVVTALTDDGTIQALSRAAERAPLDHRRRFAALEGPWPNFVDTVRTQIESIVVSHRPQKKVSGALHEETFYSAPKGMEAGSMRRVRKLIGSLSKKEVGDIVDAKVREMVLAKLAEFGTDDPAAVFADLKNLPFFQTADGRQIPIKSVRVFKKLPTFRLGSGRTARFVASDSNHHIEIFAELDSEGNEVEWDGNVVLRTEAQTRLRMHIPTIQRELGPNRKFLFSLSPGEIIECDSDSSKRGFFVVRQMSHLSSGQINIGYAPIRDARQARAMQTSRSWLWAGPESLRKRHTRKVAIGPLGDVSEAHD